MRLANYVSLADLGCPCKQMGGIGEVSCGGYCGERIYDDPDRLTRPKKPTVGQPVVSPENVNPATDQGPENNDWATDGMGAIDFSNPAVLQWAVGLGIGAAVLMYFNSKKKT